MNNNAFGNKFAFKHGHATKGYESSTYRTWSQMLSRCRNKNHKDYKWYGKRGIEVCQRWLQFKSFLEDMGERPINTTIDRVDNERGYYKNNCRWATQKEQHRNKRSNKLITFGGQTMCLYACYKWSTKEAITTPVKERKNGWKKEQKFQTLKI